MSFFDFISNMKITQVLDPDTVTADADCASVDMQGYGGVVFVALVGATGDTLDADNDINLEIEESDDDSTFTDAADADVNESVTGANTGTPIPSTAPRCGAGCPGGRRRRCLCRSIPGR